MRRSWNQEIRIGKDSNTRYRKWPFLLMLKIATGAAAYSILLPPAPDSPHFIDPSLKFFIALILLIALLLKPTVDLAKDLAKEDMKEDMKESKK